MKSVECSTCEAACCQNAVLPLSSREYNIMYKAGTDLIEIGKTKSDPSLTNYLIVGKCGLLDPDTNLCTVYDLERPDICVQFAAGSVNCVEARHKRGIPTEIDLLIEEVDRTCVINPTSWKHLNDFTTPILS